MNLQEIGFYLYMEDCEKRREEVNVEEKQCLVREQTATNEEEEIEKDFPEI